METQAQEVCLSCRPSFIALEIPVHTASLSIRALVIEFVSCIITTVPLEQMKQANLQISLLEMTSLTFE